ncbi:hypothetical protein CDD82_1619 [Ophiocordyceps australis]|uniref:Uncharacterized protein n=1 Tax=Ophiocordyceps australis TaxID=1399860 RepID=A0A2C5ZU67_9HYPO|nr:hypothetical protein CDD82_1619 [Ophiocordyceps australis]
MSNRAVIPRFLLPLQGPLWRGFQIPPSQNIYVRFVSSQKPLVLEKPAKFTPPSHGSRPKRGSVPKHYGPQMSAAEVASQKQRDYPGLMAPEGTWSHWFWTSRLLHTCITMGTLLVMALSAFFMNYAFNSPYNDLVPPISDLWDRPGYFFTAWKNVIILHEKDKAYRAGEHRLRHIDDLTKRQYYMKMHGIEPKNPITMIFGPEDKTTEELEAAVMERPFRPTATTEPDANAETTQELGEDSAQKKKWLGLF